MINEPPQQLAYKVLVELYTLTVSSERAQILITLLESTEKEKD